MGPSSARPLANGRFDLLGSSHVGDRRRHEAASSAAALGGLVEILPRGERIGARLDGGADVGEKEVVAGFGERECGRAPDTPRRPGDEDRPRHEVHRNVVRYLHDGLGCGQTLHDRRVRVSQSAH